MPTATEPPGVHRVDPARRAALARLAGLSGLNGLALFGLVPAATHAASASPTLAAAWRDGDQHHVGLIEPASARVLKSLVLPTRPHGLLVEPDGALVVAARRPGDWLLRWQPRTGRQQWAWAEPGRAFNGHVLRHGPRLLASATDTDADTGAPAEQGRLLVLRADDLSPLDDWASHGADPHAMLLHQGRLWVANGGIPTRPETGRAKLDLDRMDSSLVALEPAAGRLQGQWRLPDRRLSLRHLAAAGARIGVALQAEHDDPATRRHAPLLAVWADGRLTLPAPHGPAEETGGKTGGETGGETGGYGGDIAADGAGFVVSATRAGRLLRWQPAMGWLSPLALAEAGALAVAGGAVWAGGAGALQTLPGRRRDWPAALQLDNHWRAVAG